MSQPPDTKDRPTLNADMPAGTTVSDHEPTEFAKARAAGLVADKSSSGQTKHLRPWQIVLIILLAIVSILAISVLWNVNSCVRSSDCFTV